jgi:hypothetical protein
MLGRKYYLENVKKECESTILMIVTGKCNLGVK